MSINLSHSKFFLPNTHDQESPLPFEELPFVLYPCLEGLSQLDDSMAKDLGSHPRGN